MAATCATTIWHASIASNSSRGWIRCSSARTDEVCGCVVERLFRVCVKGIEDLLEQRLCNDELCRAECRQECGSESVDICRFVQDQLGNLAALRSADSEARR